MLAFGFAGYDVTITNFEAENPDNDSNTIILRWTAENEGNISEYEIHRRMDFDSDFNPIDQPIEATGRGEYTFEDKQVFKNQTQANQISYRLMARQNGILEEVAEIDTEYTSSGVRRTWGSIKRMFQ